MTLNMKNLFIGTRKTLLLFLLFSILFITNGQIQNKTDTNPFYIVRLSKHNFNGSINSDRTHIYYLPLTKDDALDLFRINVNLENIKSLKKYGTDPILDVTASNGRDSIMMKLPVVSKYQVLYNDGKLIDPLLTNDFETKSKNKNDTQKQTLIITVQTRLKETVNFTMNFSRLDRAQYDLKFKSDVLSIPNQHLTVVKPIGFIIDVKQEKISSLRLTVTSDDDICSVIVTVPQNTSLYQPVVETKGTDFQRYVTFTKRGDLYFTPSEIKSLDSFKIFVFISTDERICDPDADSKHIVKNKKVSLYFEKTGSNSYFLPISVLIIICCAPLIGFLIFVLYRKTTIDEDLLQHLASSNVQNEDNLIDFAENGQNEEIQMDITNSTNNSSEINLEIKDSLSTNGELLKYPISIILPAFMHIALEYHKWSQSSGANKDETCFFNHACAQPLWEFRAFNNIISNIGYFIFGFLFIAITYQRRYKKNKMNSCGVHECSLLDVTIGVFLIMQSLASSAYHLCPTDVAFQFDTPFIQVMCGLIIIRQWFVRIESPLSSVSNSLLVFVIVLNFCVAAMSHSPNIRYYVAICHLSIISIMCYTKHNQIHSKNSVNKSIHASLFVGLFFATNLILSAMYIVASNMFHVNQISTYCFIVNCLMYVIYYTTMKFLFKETISNTAKILGCLAIVTCIIAFYFFGQEEIDWTKTAAQSRALNRPCIFLEFFGSHDIWHIFSAYSSLFSFMYVSYVDDDLLNTPRTSINVF